MKRVTLPTSLHTVLDRARAAILNRATHLPQPEPTPPAPKWPAVPLRPPDAARRPDSPPAPRVWPAARPALTVPALASLTNLEALPSGPRRLLELMHDLAATVCQARAYRMAPSQATVHAAQELLARALGCGLTSIWRWTAVLKALGLLDARAHFTNSKGVTRADGTLYAVSLQRGHRAHLTHDDLAHQYRDLDADRAAGRTAWAALRAEAEVKGSDTDRETDWRSTLRAWVVTPGSLSSPPLVPDPFTGPRTVLEVAETLPLVMDAHPTKRAALIGTLGATLARAMGDQHSRAWYCGLIWKAWREECEGRAALQPLAAALSRLDADLREWGELKRPGALLATRLRSAS